MSALGTFPQPKREDAMNIQPVTSSWFSSKKHSEDPAENLEINVHVSLHANGHELSYGTASRSLSDFPDMTFGALKGSAVWNDLIAEATILANKRLSDLTGLLMEAPREAA